MSNHDDDNGKNSVIGRRPDGSAIMSADDLPFLPLPHKIVLMDGVMQIDEWFFSLRGVSKRFLYWFKERMDMWRHLDPSHENKRWLQGVQNALYEELLKSFSDPETP